MLNPTWTHQDRIHVAVLRLSVANIAIEATDAGSGVIDVKVTSSRHRPAETHAAIGEVFTDLGLTVRH